jgi:subtilisin-like proprotein convertase family protein
MKKILFTISILFVFTQANAQSFSGVGGNIPDDGTSIRFPVLVSGLPASIDSTFGVISACLNIVHPYVSDLSIWLVAPDSTYIELSSGNGGSGDNYWNTCFIDTVPVYITSGAAPYTGEYRPESPIYNVNNGQNPNSAWQLLIEDTYPFADAGILLNWTITFGNNPPKGLVLQSSNLPIVKINTLGQVIPDDPKITVQMQIIDNGMGIRNYVSDTPNVYNGQIGIEIRGSSSQMFPKKSFGFETLDSAGNEIDTSLFGMPSESDWILGANYTDKTLCAM